MMNYTPRLLGRIELIIGPMFAGKTTELMRRVKREIHACHSCFVIKYAKDTRYDVSKVASHDQMTLRAQASVSKLAEVKDVWKNFDVVAVDEGQFFEDIVPFCSAAADEGKIVFVSALDGNYLRKPFGHICDLVPLCESVEKLSAVCMLCRARPGTFTRRTVQAEEQELIGGADMYVATCRECYAKEISSLQDMHDKQVRIRTAEKELLGTKAPSANPTPVKKVVMEEKGEVVPPALRPAVALGTGRGMLKEQDSNVIPGNRKAQTVSAA